MRMKPQRKNDRNESRTFTGTFQFYPSKVKMENVGKIYDDTPDVSTGFVSVDYSKKLELTARMKSCIHRSEKYVKFRDGFLESLCNLVTSLVRIKGGPLFCPGYRFMYKPSEEWLASASFGVYGIDVYIHSGDPIFYYDERIHSDNRNVFIMGHKGYEKICKKLAEVGPDRVNGMKWGEVLGHGFPVEVHYGFIKDIPDPERFYDWINTVLMRDPVISKHLS